MNNLKALHKEPELSPAGRIIYEAQNISARLPCYMHKSYCQLRDEGVRPTDLVTASLALMFRMLDKAANREEVPKEVRHLHEMRCSGHERVMLEGLVNQKKQELIEVERELKALIEGGS